MCDTFCLVMLSVVWHRAVSSLSILNSRPTSHAQEVPLTSRNHRGTRQSGKRAHHPRRKGPATSPCRGRTTQRRRGSPQRWPAECKDGKRLTTQHMARTKMFASVCDRPCCTALFCPHRRILNTHAHCAMTIPLPSSTKSIHKGRKFKSKGRARLLQLSKYS